MMSWHTDKHRANWYPNPSYCGNVFCKKNWSLLSSNFQHSCGCWFWLKYTQRILHAKIEKREKQIHPAHNIRFNHDLQLEIDCIEWVLKKIKVNNVPNHRVEAVSGSTITDLEKEKTSPVSYLLYWVISLSWLVFSINSQ